MQKTVTTILLLLFLLTTSACNTLNAPQSKPEPATPPTPLTNQPASQPDWARQLHGSLNQFDGKTGLYAKNLKTGQNFSFNQDTIFPTASTHKLVVALAIYKYLYAEASITDKKRYDANIKKMLVVSDNPAFYELLNDIEHKKPDALTRVLADLNLVHTRIHSREAFTKYGYHSVTTPAEMAVVFETIYNEVYLGKEFSLILKEELSKTIFKEEIPRFMHNAKVFHKVGELPGVQCDVGIVDDGRDQILISSYTSTHRPPPYASNFIANISAKAYNLLRTK
ncbi:serine hydrolase [Sporomusa malonica]|uniref:Beta-lactamase class A n=1 Tax=Sporomusa malonica TaxID=112901 RepID=A0A1W2F136_9FIRM|nr:serine hydrolase [Sporomusa malonica]SMD15614.1 beta-lactamase class A [Sporomusa malonica]